MHKKFWVGSSRPPPFNFSVSRATQSVIATSHPSIRIGLWNFEYIELKVCFVAAVCLCWVDVLKKIEEK